MKDCIFCKIARHEIPSKIVFEDEYVICFHDISPAAPVHVLLVPKKHYENILEAAADQADTASTSTSDDRYDTRTVPQAIFRAVKIVAEKMGVQDSGFRLINNCGEDGGQTVDHLHFHLLAGEKLPAGLI